MRSTPTIRRVSLSLSALAGAAVAVPAALAVEAPGGPARFEVSADGHRTVHLERLTGSSAHAVALPSGALPRDVAATFPATPDFTLTLRRQVGGLAVADFDGDGRNDIFVACYISNSFPPYPTARDFILFNSPAGLSSSPGWEAALDTHTGDVQVGDLDGDGRVDVVTIHGGSVRSDAVRAYFNSASGLPTSSGYASTISARAWGTAGLLVDIDNDGDLDIVTTNQGLSPDPFRPMLQFRNLGGGSITTTPVWQSAEQSIQNGLAAGDFNADGWPDVAVAKWVNFESGIHLNDGAGTLETTPAWTVGTDGTDRGAAAADVDVDGDIDPYFGGDPSTGFANDAGSFTPVWANTDPLSGPQDFRLHDADGDGDEDLAEIHFSTGKAYLYENDAGSLATMPTWTFDAPEVGTALAFGDLNGDGLDDLVLGYSGDVCLRVFYSIPTPSCPADLNSDGILDFGDVALFIDAFNAQSPDADLNADGIVDFGDVSAFADAFNAGC